VLAVRPEGPGVVVETDRARHVAGAAVLTQGPWLRFERVTVERQVQLWFEPTTPAAFAAGRFPVIIHFAGDDIFYGLPPFGVPAVKLCRHHGGEPAHPETVDRSPRPADEADVRAWAAAHLPDAAGRLFDAQVCLYTNTPDANFLIGELEPRVFVAGGFSGHGFKLAPVVGEIVADLVTRGQTAHDIGLFDPGRFQV
jgi:sarcosine oxidase